MYKFRLMTCMHDEHAVTHDFLLQPQYNGVDNLQSPRDHTLHVHVVQSCFLQ